MPTEYRILEYHRKMEGEVTGNIAANVIMIVCSVLHLILKRIFCYSDGNSIWVMSEGPPPSTNKA